MNRMVIPRILRAITWISIPVFVISLAAGLWLNGLAVEDLPGWLAPNYPLVMSVLEVSLPLSFVLMLTAYNFSLLFDWVLNGLLRRFGKPAMATIVSRQNTGISTGRFSHIWRVTLEVHPADGEAFEAITEDMGGGGTPGEVVPVRYDPFTRSAAIQRPWSK